MKGISTVIYIDVLVVINIFINFFLLLLSSFIFKRSPNRVRLLAGATVGGALSLVILLPSISPVLSVLIKLAGSAVIVLVSFRLSSPREFLRCFLCFFAANFCFAGVMLAIELCIKPNAMIFKNGTVYFDISLLVLALLTVVCYVIISIIARIVKPSTPKNSVCTVRIEAHGKICESPALIDTGNSLTDGFSGDPVIVACYSTVKALLPEHSEDFFKTCELPKTDDPYWESRFRLIPYSCVGKEGLLPSFRPDCVTVVIGGREIKSRDVIVGVRSDAPNGESSVVLNPMCCI